jgi:FkbM family methyltransferase
MYKSTDFYKNLAKGVTLRLNGLIKKKRKAINLTWFLVKYLKHLPPGKIHTHKLFRTKTFFYDGPGYLHGLKEIFIEEIYQQQLPDNAYIIDCGAHIGLSVIYLKHICKTAEIVCFEPDSKNFALLQKNIASHKLENVDAKNEAIWIEDTELDFMQEGNMESKIVESTSAASVRVKASRLKNYLDREVDFLKIDIEGAEYVVMKDISEKLYNVKSMFVEYHGSFGQNSELLEILQLIIDAGFQFYIREASPNYRHPFLRTESGIDYDVQLNIFCFRAN